MNKIITYLILFSAFLIQSQNQITIEKKWIRNCISKMDWYSIEDKNTVKIGEVNTEIIKSKKTITIVTNVRFSNAKAPWVDSTIAEINTLKPIRHSSANSLREMTLVFSNGEVNGYYYDKKEQKHYQIKDSVNEPFFDSNLYPILLGWLPLKEGFTKTLNIYNYSPNLNSGILKANLLNVESSTYTGTNSRLKEVWVLTVSDEISNARHIYYFGKSDRILRRHEIYLKDQSMLMMLSE